VVVRFQHVRELCCIVTLVVSSLVAQVVHSEVGLIVAVQAHEVLLLGLEEARLASSTTEGVVALGSKGIFVILRCLNHSVGSLIAHGRAIWNLGASTVHENGLILHQTRLVARPYWLMATVLGLCHVVLKLILL
jgi:hypothetical protein